MNNLNILILEKLLIIRVDLCSFNAVFYYLMGVAALCAISALLIPTRKEDMLDLEK